MTLPLHQHAQQVDLQYERENSTMTSNKHFHLGYFCMHGLKAKVGFLPIGIIGSVFITELCQNDNGVQNISGLNNYLLHLLDDILFGGLFPCLYCDGIFAMLAAISPRFTNPTPELRLLNIRL